MKCAPLSKLAKTGKPAPTDITEAIMVQQVLENMQAQLIDTSATS
jgi:hypothetical protein